MKSRRALALVGLSIVFLGAIIILRLRSQTISKGETSSSNPVAVAVAKADFGVIRSSVKATGALEGIHEAEIVSETSGKIVRIDAEVDQYLPSGGRIAEVESELQEISLDQARAQVAAAQANSDKAELDLKRVQSLYEQKAVSESQMENANLAAKAALAQLRGAQAAEKLAQKHFDDTILKTPVAGRLARKFITVGKMISPGMTVATVVEDIRMKLVVGVPEASVSSVRPGDSVEVTSDAVQGMVYHGTVRNVALKADPHTRTFQVEIEFPNDRMRSVKSGMFARAVITTSSVDDFLVVPSAAVTESEQGTHMVLLVRNSRVVARHVRIGLRGDSLTAIISGLARGDTVITLGIQNLQDGTIVKSSNLN